MEFLIRSKWVLSTLVILLVIAGIPYLKKALIPNNELSIWFVKNDPALIAYQDFNERYGNDRVIILLVHDQQGLFRQEKIQQIQNLSNRLPSIDGVKTVSSLTNVRDMFRIRINDTLRIKFTSPFLGSFPSSTDSIEAIKERVLSSAFLTNYIVNKEGTCALVIIELDRFEKIDFKREMIIS